MSDAAVRDVDVDALLALVDDALGRGLPDDVAPIAGFDADGTLWRGDVGDHAFLGAHDAGLLDDATLDGPYAAWLARAGLDDARAALGLDERAAGAGDVASRRAGGGRDVRASLRAVVDAIGSGALVAAAAARGRSADHAIADAYAMQAWIYAPATTAQIGDYGARLFADGFAKGVFPTAGRLLDGLRDRGVRVVVVSASHRALVGAGVRALGAVGDDVHGMTPDVDGAGRTLPSVARPLYGDEKQRVLRAAAGGKRPFLALGDGVLTTDRAMLADALLPVAVEPKPHHLAAARAWGRGAVLRY